ncbi:hypothetical protein BDW75DRAFT_126890 [Aspergillus navahoensis]
MSVSRCSARDSVKGPTSTAQTIHTNSCIRYSDSLDQRNPNLAHPAPASARTTRNRNAKLMCPRSKHFRHQTRRRGHRSQSQSSSHQTVHCQLLVHFLPTTWPALCILNPFRPSVDLYRPSLQRIEIPAESKAHIRVTREQPLVLGSTNRPLNPMSDTSPKHNIFRIHRTKQRSLPDQHRFVLWKSAVIVTFSFLPRWLMIFFWVESINS